MAEDICAQVGDHALAQPVDVIKACGAGDCQDEADDDQHRKVAIDEKAVLGAEAEVDNAPHGHGDRERRHRGYEERDAGERQLARVSRDVGAQGQQRVEGRAALLRLVCCNVTLLVRD